MSAGRMPFAPPFDHLVYVRIFEGCNLDCKHCFLPLNPKRMTHEQVARIPEIVGRFAKPGQTVLLHWHGGEPTLMGAAWLEQAIALVHENGPDHVWRHGIQTNLMTYGPDWARLLHQHFDGQIGISWDYGIRLHRGEATNARFESQFWPAVRQVLADGLEPALIVTATRLFFERYRNPFDFFQLMAEHKLTKVHLERITRTGAARDNWSELGTDNAEYADGMARFLRAYVLWQKTAAERGGPRLSISPLDSLMQSAERLGQGLAGGYGCWSGSCDTTFHTIDAMGYKPGCTALTAELDNKRATQVLMIGDYKSARAEREEWCGSCRFRPICKTGCLSVRITDNSGECSGGKRLFEAAEAMARHQVVVA